MQIHNAAVTGSFTYNGIDISDITGSEQSVVSLNEFSASILNYTSSNNQSVATLQGATASLQGATSSLFAYTASNSANVASLFATSASLNAAVTQIYNATASLYAATSSIYGATSSLFNYSASSNLRIGSLEQYTASLNTRSASFACVNATNNFACTQYFSNTSNAISFTSTGSLYSDGGMRLTKDLYVSGTSYFNNVTVFGTQSINYITSSQLNIASNLITVNTSTPAVRFGGLAVYDSGSLGTGLTGSLLWDSENNHWVYSNPSGSTYSGGMFISGPRSAALGSEVGTTNNALMKGQGGDHITSSGIFEYGNATCFYGNSYISSSGATCFGGNTTIAGNLGVGTITPGQLIDVYKTSNDAVIRITSCTAGAYIVADSCTDGYYGLVLQSNSNQRWFIGGYTTSDLTFKTSQTGGNEWLRINRTSGVACFTCQICAPSIVFCSSVNNGYTPIKVCNPNPGSSAYTEILINNDTTSLAGLFYNSSTRSVDGGVCSLTLYNDSTNGNLRLRTGNNLVLATGATTTDRLIINTNGIATFACQVCAPAFVGGTVSGTTGTFSGKLTVSQASTDFVAEFTNTANSTPYGLRVKDAGTPANNYPLLSVTNNAGSAEYFRVNSGTGMTTFTGVVCSACRICSPALTTNLLRVSDEATYGLTICKGANSYPVIFTDGAQSIGFITAQSGVSYGERLRILHTGEACFACRICSSGLTVAGTSTFTDEAYFTDKLGVGTVSLTYKAEVAGAIGNYWNGTAFTGTPLAIAISNTQPGGYDPVLLYRQTDSGGTTKLSGGIGMVGTGPWTAGNNGSQVSDMYFLVRNGSGGVTERMRIKAGGDVGIGTTNPGYKLDIQGGNLNVQGASAYAIIADTTSYQAGVGGTLYLNGNYRSIGDLTTAGYIKGSKTNSTDGDYGFDLVFGNQTYLVGVTEKMRITSGGRVGINCTTPTSPLTIRCDSSSTASSIEIATCFAGSYRYVSVNAGNGISYCIPAGTSQSPYIEIQGGSPGVGGGSFKIRTGAMGSPADRLIIAQDGTACFSSVVCSPNFVSSGKIHSPYYSQRFDGDGNGNYYSSTVFQANSTTGAGANWVTLARIDSFNSGNTRVIAKVTALMISATADQGNEHVGYGLINSSLTSYACPMTLSTGATLGNANVGTIKWCGTCLLYCAPAGSYFTSMIKTELAAKDSATITLFCGSTNY